MVQPISLHWMAEAENSKRTRGNVLIDRDLLSNLIKETSFLVAQARIWGKTESECRMVSGLLAQVTAAMNGNPIPSEHGLECPICHKTVDDADYWDGDRCLKCRLEGAGRLDLANILSRPEPFILNNVREWPEATLRPMPVQPDAHLESDYEDRTYAPDAFAEPDEDRTCLPDSEMP